MVSHEAYRLATPRTSIALVAALALATGACASRADDPEQTETSDSAINPSMVGFSGHILIAGASVEIDYSGQPMFLEVRTVFTEATSGVHTVTVQPLDAGGDAALWITDAAYTNLAISRPTDSSTAALDFEFVSGWSTPLIIFRDEAMKPGRFRVTLGAPVNPPSTDPDEGDSVGGVAPDGLAGSKCDGVLTITSSKQMYDYQGNPTQPAMPKTGTLSAGALILSESQVRVTTAATYSPGRDLHKVASNSFTSSPTQMEWNIPVARDASGSIVGSLSVGGAKAHVTIGATQLAWSFSGKISQPWYGNTETLQVAAGGKMPLSACAGAAIPAEPTCCDKTSEPGCADADVEACVCAADSYCCDSSWDEICVGEIESLGCGTCAP